MTTPSSDPANWFTSEIWMGVERMLKLNLRDAPIGDNGTGDFAFEFSKSAWAGRIWEQNRDTPNIRKFFREFPSRSAYWPRLVDFEQFLIGTHPEQITKVWNVYDRVVDGTTHCFPKGWACPPGFVEITDVRTDADKVRDAESIQTIMAAPKRDRYEIFSRLVAAKYIGRSFEK